jgi:hypothetical protein
MTFTVIFLHSQKEYFEQMVTWSFFNTRAWSFDADHATAYTDMWQMKWNYYQQCFPKETLGPVERMSVADMKARAVWLVSSECILLSLGTWLIVACRRMN